VAEGATAVKVEPPGGDPLAEYSRAWYDTLHAGVTIVPLDLKTGEGRAALEPSVARADVVLTSQRPAALARLDLAPDALMARHPHLRVVTIVGDRSAPGLPGHDVTYQAEAGLLRADLPATFLADLAGAAEAVTAVLLALREPAGTHRVVGLRDALAPFAAPRRHGLTGPDGRFGGADPAYGVYAAADGLVAVAALEPHFRARLYAALGLPVDAPLHDVIRARTCDAWDTFARAHDVPLSRVR
jgi:crotonobetainyl-CoA:carnitine CoA-transferase CaiB-like acyl-CoA transferase